MADITMCVDHDCTLKANCYRYTAAPSPHRQSYFVGTVKKDRAENFIEDKCDYFWDNKPIKKKKK